MGKTVVLGASPNSRRYSNLAIKSLQSNEIDVAAVGRRAGNVDGLDIFTNRPHIEDVDTITLYVGTDNQPSWYDYILSLNPRRIIFNPGTENLELEQLARKRGVVSVRGCTLVMLSIGSY
jgi:predicted CoA-binding protein